MQQNHTLFICDVEPLVEVFRQFVLTLSFSYLYCSRLLCTDLRLPRRLKYIEPVNGNGICLISSLYKCKMLRWLITCTRSEWCWQAGGCQLSLHWKINSRGTQPGLGTAPELPLDCGVPLKMLLVSSARRSAAIFGSFPFGAGALSSSHLPPYNDGVACSWHVIVTRLCSLALVHDS